MKIHTPVTTTANNRCDYMITNDQQTSHWQHCRCEKGKRCLSRDLYHSENTCTNYPLEQTGDNQIVVGFHQNKSCGCLFDS
jgi:hypothetical protein